MWGTKRIWTKCQQIKHNWKTNPEWRKAAVRSTGEFTVLFTGGLFVVTFVGNFTLCMGPSMEPTLNTDGGLVYVDIWSHKVLQKAYKPGDVVIAKHPEDQGKSKPSTPPLAVILKFNRLI